MGVESSEELLAAARNAGFSHDETLPDRIDAALAATDDRAELGRLHVAKAVSLQGRGDASRSAAASCDAVPHLLASGLTSTAAFASALAAVFLDQIEDPNRAVEYAVDALVMLADVRLDDLESVRASLALSGYFTRVSAFDSAVESGRRAFVGAKKIEGAPLDAVAYTFGYICAEAAHVTSDPHRRSMFQTDAAAAADWLRTSGSSPVSTQMLADGLDAEIALANGERFDRERLDATEALYDSTAPDLVAWHQLVRGTNARRHGDDRAALPLLHAAIPALEASADNHCLVRAIDERAQARAALGDPAGAFADARQMASLVRAWQVAQGGRLAVEVKRRAELQLTASALRSQADQLTADLDHDVTTGCRSRRWLESHLKRLEVGTTYGTVLMFDIDRFKSINDTHGHGVGDAVLARFGALVVGATAVDHEVARFGGEEFLIIAPHCDSEAGAELAERIRLDIAAHDWESIAPGIDLTTSVGVSYGRFSNVRDLLASADDALLEAKRQGRNRTVVSSTSVPTLATPAPA